MNKKLAIILIVGLTLFVASEVSFAMTCCASEGDADKSGHDRAQQGIKTGAIDVGNKVCPVTGEKINESEKATYEYNGKIYNFCCPMCIPKFKKNPEKYIKKIAEGKL